MLEGLSEDGEQHSDIAPESLPAAGGTNEGDECVADSAACSTNTKWRLSDEQLLIKTYAETGLGIGVFFFFFLIAMQAKMVGLNWLFNTIYKPQTNAMVMP